MPTPSFRHLGCLVTLFSTGSALAFLALAASSPAWAQRTEPIPGQLEGVDLVERSGNQIPTDLRFTDDHGEAVQLSDYFDGERPGLLTLNYSSCPMLCSLQLNGLIDGLREMEWTAGEEFEIVTVSIDPAESTALAKRTKAKYLRDYGRPEAAAGWHFLTGTKANIDMLAQAVGFQYKYLPERKEYAHAAVTYVVTPDGILSRNLYGVIYDPKTVRLSLVEAGDGAVGTAFDKILLFCFHYDASEGKYGPAAQRLMMAGGGITVLFLGLGLSAFWRRDARRSREHAMAGSDETHEVRS